MEHDTELVNLSSLQLVPDQAAAGSHQHFNHFVQRLIVEQATVAFEAVQLRLT